MTKFNPLKKGYFLKLGKTFVKIIKNSFFIFEIKFQNILSKIDW